MASCRRCGSPEMNLNRETGELTCNSCQSPNLIGTPDTFGPHPETTYDKKTGTFTHEEYFPNTIFNNSKE